MPEEALRDPLWSASPTDPSSPTSPAHADAGRTPSSCIRRFSWSSGQLECEGVGMETSQRHRAVREMRGPTWSHGPPLGSRRDHLQQFWEGIARGVTSEEAAAAAGLSSAVGPACSVKVAGRTLMRLLRCQGATCRSLSEKRSPFSMGVTHRANPRATRTAHRGSRNDRQVSTEWTCWAVTPTPTTCRVCTAFSLVRGVTDRPIDPSHRSVNDRPD